MADYSATHQLIYIRQLNLNAVGDTPIFVPFARFNVYSMQLANASTTLAASPATIGLYSGPGATGTTIVTPATATGLTTADSVDTRTIAGTGLITPTTVNNTLRQLYIRVGVAHGSAALVDVEIGIRRWQGP